MAVKLNDRIGQLQGNLSWLLGCVENADARKDYTGRYGYVIQAMALAESLGYRVGVRNDPTEPEWPVFFIELPTGQVSWHMPQHTEEWDGHDTREKYRRIEAYQESVR
jgi:hypothetical protein